DGVLVDPVQAALGLGPEEAALDPGLALEVELAGDVGVGAAARQRDQAALVGRAQAVGAVPHPVLALGLVQRVEVEDRFPGGIGLAVLLERGAAPDAALVVTVLPEVVVVPADLLHPGDLGVGVQHLADAGLHGLELGRGGEGGVGPGVLGADPGQLALAGHVLQPLVGIVGHVGLLGMG